MTDTTKIANVRRAKALIVLGVITPTFGLTALLGIVLHWPHTLTFPLSFTSLAGAAISTIVSHQTRTSFDDRG